MNEFPSCLLLFLPAAVSGLFKFVNCFEILQDERFYLSEIIIAFYISPLPVLISTWGPTQDSAFPARSHAKLTHKFQLPILQLFDTSQSTSELKVKYMYFPEPMPKHLAFATLRSYFCICVWLHVILCASRDCIVLFLPLLKYLLILGSIPATMLFCDPTLYSCSHTLFMFLWFNCKPVRAGISLPSGEVKLQNGTLTGAQRVSSVQGLRGSNTVFEQENLSSVQLHV